MKTRKSIPLTLEVLENRWCPAAVAMINSDGDLEITGTPTIVGGGVLGLRQIAPGVWRFRDFPTPAQGPFVTSGNIIIDIPEASGRDFIGVDLNGNSMTNSLLVDIGAGDDTLTIFGGDTIAGDVIGIGVNQLEFGAVVDLVGNSVVMDASRENIIGPSTYDLSGVEIGSNLVVLSGSSDDEIIMDSPVGGNVYLNLGNGFNTVTQPVSAPINGSFTYFGGSGDDEVFIEGVVGGSLYVNLGGGTNTLSLDVDSVIEGSLSAFGRSGDDEFSTFEGVVENNVYINFGGGMNTVVSTGQVRGRFFGYFGGSGVDEVTLNGDAGDAFHFLSFGGDADILTIDTLAALSFLFADMGAGVDTVDDFLSAFRFFPKRVLRV
ncbi:MAG: hypothetical protein ACFCD0_14550 [Gemmataceae bacterium]